MAAAMKTEIWEVPILGKMEKVEVRRSSRETISMEVDRRGELIVRVPYRLAEKRIQSFLIEKHEWIDEHVALVRERNKALVKDGVFSEEELKEIRKRAAEDLKPRLAGWAKVMGVSYSGVSIRFQKSRWGSCSSKGNISLNGLLVLMREEVRDYTIVHELCHRKQMNHSPLFWKEVEKVLPDYRQRKFELKQEGAGLIARLP